MKVRTKSMYRSVQGDTVRQLGPKDLPTGCSVLTDGIPCTFRMTHVAIEVNPGIWNGDEQPNVVLSGYCKSHRPRISAMIELPERLELLMNGDRSQQSRLRRMENAKFVLANERGVRTVHLFLRADVIMTSKTESVGHKNALCGKLVKRGMITTRGQMRGTEMKMCLDCLQRREMV